MQRYMLYIIICLIPILTYAQSRVNVTGRVSLRSTYFQYDEKSDIKPDSIPTDQYSKTYLIPGGDQSINMAIFARTRNMDITLLGDIRHNQWDKLNSFDKISRLSLSARFGQNEIVIGDFFDSGSEFFLQSREVRGTKMKFRWNDLWNKTSYFTSKISAGQVQRSIGIGTRLKDMYRQYENSGQFQRYFGSAVLHTGDSQLFDIGLKYLYGKDDKNSIKESINEPLTNQNIGSDATVYLLNKKLQLFSEGYMSTKDTVSAQNVTDHAYKAGFDLRVQRFKLLAFYQRLGYDYYSAGYPYLQNNRKGFSLSSGYYFPKLVSLSINGEEYSDNLTKDKNSPTTNTLLADAGFTTHFPKFPEFTLKWRYRADNSDTIMDTVKTTKKSLGFEAGLAYQVGQNRFSLSTIYIDLTDKSVLAAGSPLGTEQFVSSFNFYTRPDDGLFISGGAVYSTLNLTNKQSNKNIYAYVSGRWDIIPRVMKLETSANYIFNDAAHGGTQDMLSDYNQLGSEISLEYFFNSNLSLKLIAGNSFRNMQYSTAEALAVIIDEDYGPTFFNGYESYDGLKYGAEINWIF